MDKTTSKMHTIGLNAKYYYMVKSGEKTLEGRLHDEKRQEFCVGDTLRILLDPERKEFFDTIIEEKLLYPSFFEMAKCVDKVALGFGGATEETIVSTYLSFYSIKDEKRYGVVIFRIKKI